MVGVWVGGAVHLWKVSAGRLRHGDLRYIIPLFIGVRRTVGRSLRCSSCPGRWGLPDLSKTSEKRNTIMMRSHYCGQLNESLDGQEITLCGWVHRRRDHGGVIFLDIRDREGLA